MCEQIGVDEVLQISSQESVEAVEHFLSGANFREDVRTDWGSMKCPRSQVRRVSRQSKIVVLELI